MTGLQLLRTLSLALATATFWRGWLDDHEKGLSPLFLVWKRAAPNAHPRLHVRSEISVLSMTYTAVPCHLATTQAHSSTAQGDQFKGANTAYLNSLEANLSCLNRQVNSRDYNCLWRAVCFGSSWIREMLQHLQRKVALVLHTMHDSSEIWGRKLQFTAHCRAADQPEDPGEAGHDKKFLKPRRCLSEVLLSCPCINFSIQE